MANFTQCYAIKRPSKVLAVTAELGFLHEDELKDGKHGAYQEPNYSRFTMTIIDKSGEKTVYPMCNIPTRDLSFIKQMKDIALQTKVQAAMQGMSLVASAQNNVSAISNSNETDDSGSNLTFLFGSAKGMTVQDTYDDPAFGPNELVKYKQMLEKNMDKYAVNCKLVNEIDRVLGNTNTAPVQTQQPQKPLPGISVKLKPLVIYQQDYKFLKTRKNDNGDTFVYSVKMEFNPQMKYPWSVTISNGFAPVLIDNDGRAQVNAKGITDQTKASMVLADMEFSCMIDKMYDIYRDYSCQHIRNQINLVRKLTEEEKAKLAQSSTKTA